MAVKTITYSLLAEDLKKDNRFFEVYPQFSAEIQKYRQSPGCGGCRDVISKIMKGDTAPLKKIYGDDIVVDMNSFPKVRIPKYVLKKMTLDEYEKYINNYQGMFQGAPPSVMYVPEQQLVYVTTVEFTEQEMK
jgi:hypothetical protein